ncbi:MAG: 4-coumarate--CoA ligase [Pseudomonadota bacterium]
MNRQFKLSRNSVTRLTLDMLSAELASTRGRTPLELGAAQWGIDTHLDEDGLELDSLERLNASSALNAYFHLHEYGAEDYLLAMQTVSDWVDLIMQSLADTGERLTFRTSGSTGKPKECVHRVRDLVAEAQIWADMFSATKRIVSLVPSHHIYGTLWSIFLPQILGVPCHYDRLTPSRAIREASDGEPTIVVATPTMWQFLEKSFPEFSPNLLGVTSTGPMPTDLGTALRAKGLARLIEIYGSSETGAIGWRDQNEAEYQLLDQWRRTETSQLVRVDGGNDGDINPVMDKLRWKDDRHFTVEGRIDGAVQVGGYNVFPDRIRTTLLKRPGVKDAAVRLDEQSGRLKAFLVPLSGEGDGPDLIEQIDKWCSEALTNHERPRSFAFGAELPLNEMGKLQDW